MSVIYSGATPKFLLRVTDDNGVQLDPSDVNDVVEMLIWIYNSINGIIIARLYLNTSPGTGWRQASVKEVIPGDKRVLFYLTEEETTLAPLNMSEIQINTTFPDTDYPDSKRIDIGVGRFHDVKTAKSS